MQGESIAVIGAGIAGLASAWFLREHCSVSIFERDSVLGGHARTLEIRDPEGNIGIDVGFIVFNPRNYPLLTRLFAALDVPTQDTDMSFGYSVHPRGTEYAGSSLATLFVQKRNLLRPRFLRMLADIIRFNRIARESLAAPNQASDSLGDFLQRHRLGKGFAEDYLLPMGAAIWSCPSRTMLGFPAHSFLQFFHNHGLLDLVDRPQWKTVVGGSRAYVERLRDTLDGHRIHHGPVTQVRRNGSHWEVSHGGTTHLFDRVVMACHADQTLDLLQNPSEALAAVLRAVRFQTNRAVLHTDLRWLPRLPGARSSWNYLSRNTGSTEPEICVSYWMNQLHRLETRTPYIVTLNPWSNPHPTSIIAELEWQHPILDSRAIQAQKDLMSLQGQDGLYVAGAWTGYGFHEDGIRSALAIVRAMGVADPWPDLPAHLPA
jgi:predicted NAD/FAD-binding protein